MRHILLVLLIGGCTAYETVRGLTDRWWPTLTNALGRGCRYACPPAGPGCNAEQGCYCPTEVQ